MKFSEISFPKEDARILWNTNKNGKITEVTFYLDKNSKDFLIDIFVNRLKSSNKSDKSAIICEAIALLHQKDLYNLYESFSEEELNSELNELRQLPEVQEYEKLGKMINLLKGKK